ncbi:alpha/beta fold hydrolase [Rhodobacteraceae bacterium D3-12]|nr:alpha/beta fold hydrolase [Rhodobacteraceae bacterium D3-12]
MADMKRIQFLAAIALLTVLAACTRPATIGFSQEVEGLASQTLFVASQRTAGQAGQMFGERRSEKMNYAELRVSVPPKHKLGHIERAPGRSIADPMLHFAPLTGKRVANIEDFSRNIKREKVGNGSVMIFVHGYNNTLEDAAFRLAQIRHDFDMQEPAILFSWPSSGDPRGYIYDRDSVLFARDGFEQLIRDLRARGHRDIVIVAHSMGGYLTMETLRQIAIKGGARVMDAIDAVILMSPDIDPDVFRQQARAIGKLPQPFLIMTSRKDKVLSLAELLTGRKPRLGRIEDEQAVAGLDVTLIDLTRLDDGSAGGHLVAVSSEAAIKLLKGLDNPIQYGGRQLRDFVLLGGERRTGLIQ